MLKAKKLHPDAKLPQKAHASDAGFDLFAAEKEILWKGPICQIRTGIAIAIPQGFAGLILEKSGLALNAGLQIHGGVIDANYRGEVIVLASIHTHNDIGELEIHPGNKIAQLIVVPIHPDNSFAIVSELDETDRGENGFGSTGA